MKSKANEIFLLDVDINVLRALVNYMYTGVAVIDPSYIHDFFDKGRRFKVQGLVLILDSPLPPPPPSPSFSLMFCCFVFFFRVAEPATDGWESLRCGSKRS